MPVRLRGQVNISLASLDWQAPPRDAPLDQLLGYVEQQLGQRPDPQRLVLSPADWAELELEARKYADQLRNRNEGARWLAAWKADWRKPSCLPAVKVGQALYVK